MADTNYVDFLTPVVNAEWLNEANALVYRAGVITLERHGGSGDNVVDNVAAFVAAVAALTTAGGGVIQLRPGKTYYFNTDAMAGAIVATFTNLKGVIIDGRGSTIRTGTTNKLLTFFNVTDTNGFALKDLYLTSGYAVLDSLLGVEWTKFAGSCRNLVFINGGMTYGRTGFYCLGTVGTPAVTTKNIVALNWTLTSVYYPQLFNASGDNYFARGIVTLNCGRSYFPIAPISNHDVAMESQHGGPFSDCLFKVYSSTLDTVKMSDMRLHYKSTGRYAGSGAQGADEAAFAFDFQQLEAGTSAGAMNNIEITCDLDFSATDTNAKVLTVRKYTLGGGYDSTTRGHKFENIKLSGKIRNTQRLTDVTIDMYSVVGGQAWTGETGQNVALENLVIEGTNAARTDVRYNGQVNTASGQNFSMEGVRAPGLFTLTNGTYGNIAIDRSKFANKVRENSDYIVYGTIWTGAASNPAIGNGSLASWYSINNGICEVTISVVFGTTTTYGTGAWRFSFPFLAANVAVGSVHIFKAGTANYVGVAKAISGTNYCTMFRHGDGAELQGTTAAWANTDSVLLTLRFPIT